MRFCKVFSQKQVVSSKIFTLETDQKKLESKNSQNTYFLGPQYLYQQDLRNGTNYSGNILKMTSFCTRYSGYA